MAAMATASMAGVAGQAAPAVRVFATGFDNPRGLAFGPDGMLYVAEAGSGGTATTVTTCPDIQIGPPYGPYTNGLTARISRVDRRGHRTTVVDHLPSAQSLIPDYQGAADVAFVNGEMHALLQGGGCSYGSGDIPKSVIAVNPATHQWRRVADLGAFRRANPSPVTDDDLEPEGVFYNLETIGDHLYAVDANSAAVVEIGRDGRVTTVLDVASRLGHVTPTALTSRNGRLYIGNLYEFPIVDGASRVLEFNPADGGLSTLAEGFTAIVGLTFDRRGRLYVLEMGNGHASGFPEPRAGRVVRLDTDGRRTVIARDLTFPTGITIGPDGFLYVSNHGFDIPAAGTGEIVAIDVNDCEDDGSWFRGCGQ